MGRVLIVPRTATETPRIVATAVARPCFVMGPIVVVGVVVAAKAARMAVPLVITRIVVARIEVHSRTTLPM